MNVRSIPGEVIYQKRFEVTPDMSAKGIGLDVSVLSTPSLIMAMEITAHESIAEYLSNIETTVGGGICIRHLSPTRVGEHFTVAVRLTTVEKSKLDFQVEAFDSHAKIADGEHYRFVVNKQKFRERLEKR